MSIALGPQDVLAQSDATAAQTSGSARVAMSGKLRVDSQHLMALACVAALDRSDASLADLEAVRAEIDSKISALRDGNQSLGIRGAESNGRVLRAIEEVSKAWAPLSDGVKALSLGMDAGEVIGRMTALDDGFDQKVESMSATVAGVYSDANTLSMGAVMAIKISVRQDMLLERIAKHNCLQKSGLVDALPHQAKLQEAVSLFETSMSALLNGAPDSGLMAPPTDVLKAALKKSETDWLALRPGITQNANLISQPAYSLLTQDLNNVFVLYTLATSSQPDFFRIPLEAYATETLARWLNEPQMVISLREQNQQHADLDAAAIEAMDQTWRAERKSGDHQIIAEMMQRPLSRILKMYQDGTGGLVTEVFVMDNKGLNVGQSEITSDLWQGDEAKWQETFGEVQGTMHVSDVEFDESTGFY
ncbi:MAG: type IV pili methyl-accepting chemotaxis transducer N-terminal domain-containing protein, partial [Pseudomonadota bacterium]